MPVEHKEVAFEAAIEESLLSAAGGWIKSSSHDYDRALGLDTRQLFAFIEETQTARWAKLVKLLGGDESSAREKFAKRVAAQISEHGAAHVLRRGVSEHGITIALAYFKPAHGLTEELLERYAKNRLSVTRQLMYSERTDDELDLGLFVNGLPVATGELKNHLSGQDVEDAKRQYRNDRDPKELLFAKRAIVHFAVDPDLVFLTTKLAGKATVFFPFNRGDNGGAGNPENPGGYKTSYLWEQVLRRDAWLDILHRFVHLDTKESYKNGKKRVERDYVFPRYHQWDCVLKMEAAVLADGVGTNYLAEHSAGSGKSKTISWNAHRLSTLHDANDEKVFDQVIIVTDRIVLDRQLRDEVAQFSATKGVVEKIEHGSKQLAEALAKGTSPIIVTTLQKFPFAQVLDVILEKTNELQDRRYAIVVDEAHSSQTGEAAASLKAVLGAGKRADDDGEEGVDVEDEVVAALATRGPQPNLSFFAFTATPKARTLNLFGTPGTDGKPRAFHLYSMRQAIEEGFILDVLESYTTYTTFWKVAKSLADDPEVVKPEAVTAIARFVSLHPTNIAQKVEIMVEHFAASTAAKIGGKAKAMIVTSSRLHAVRYRRAVEKYLVDKGYPFKALVAFSDTVHDPKTALDYTETQMNGFPESQTAETFKNDEYRILIVAEKYQTGFDQPLLHTMYVDKRLDDVRAVQTLSRLNRIYPGKDDTFVLDFRNDAEAIEKAFEPYYETTIAEPTDPNLLFDAEARLRDSEILRDEEIEQFAKVFYKPKAEQTKADHAALYAALQPAKERFGDLDQNEQEEFRNRLLRFVKVYAFLSQIVPYLTGETERLYVYGRFLALYLPPKERGGLDLGEDEVTLTHLRQVKTGERTIKLKPTDEPLDAFTGDGTGPTPEPETGRLSEVIDVLNERFGLTLTEADKLYFDQIEETLVKSDELKAQAKANEIDNFRFPFEQQFDAAVVDRQEANEELFKKLLEEPEFRDAVKGLLLERVYERLTDEPAA